MSTRRDFLKAGALTGSGLYLASKSGFIRRALAQVVPGGSLDPYAIPRFVTPLHMLSAMPPTSAADAIDYYEVAARQISRQILPCRSPAPPCGRTDRSTTRGRFTRRPRRSRRGIDA